MGIESDQLVFDYLSRVGDLAQQHQLPSATRMRLVSELRNEIDRRRSKAPVDNPAAVRRILSRLGTPDEIVTSAGQGGASPAGADTRAAAVPVQRDPDPVPRPKGLRRAVPRPRRTPEADGAETAAGDRPVPPRHAGDHGPDDDSGPSDWWRVDGDPVELGEGVPGFVGGVEIPGLIKPPPRPRKPDSGTGSGPGPGTPDGDGAAAETAPKPATSWWRRARTAPVKATSTPKTAKPVPVTEDEGGAPRVRRLPRLRTWTNPLLLLAAVLLVAGAALGNWFALGLGWLIAYGSRRLSPHESKWAVLGMPGLVAAAGIVWLWGRTDGRWGDPIAEGHMDEALAQTWPWVVRGAAVASALYLVWRSQRRR